MDYQLKESLLPKLSNYTTVEQVFAARGIAPENIEHYLNVSDKDVLSCSLMDNIDLGIKMLMSHIKNKDSICLICDCDVDGFTSAALLINYLNCLFPGYTQNYISYRLHSGKQHGIEENFIQDFIEAGYKLILCPDSASNDYKQHKELKEAGIDVLVLDHHNAEKVSEDACIINNQLCEYPNKTLSGVGVVYKFCCRMDEIIGCNFAEQFLDLVAVGAISDMMDIRNYETKYFINQGLDNINNPFIKEMVKVQDYSISRAGGLCPFAVSFYIAPQVNGTIRMGNLAEKTLLFESMLDFKAYDRIPSTKRGCKGQYETRVEQACRNCTNIKRNQSKAIDESLEVIENVIQEKQLTQNKIIAVKLDKNHLINRNLTGLIANQLMSKYQHPILILTEVDLDNGEISWEGSGRGYETSNFNDLRSFVKESGYASLAEGHAQAFGVAIPQSNFKNFIEYSNKALENCSFDPCIKVDFIWHNYDFSQQDVIDLAQLDSVWGQELEKPYVAIENITIQPKDVFLMSKDKNPTLKIELSNGVSLIKFKSSEEEFNELTKYPSGSVNITIVGTCKINEWNGIISPQIEIKQYEIIGETKYYF
jgi:single-stranded-DNA-specific exonuclease